MKSLIPVVGVFTNHQPRTVHACHFSPGAAERYTFLRALG